MDPKEQLEKILKEHKNERVCVVATTCTGKSTLLKQIPYANDMDDLIFPKLSKEERDYVCQKPWTKDIGKTMIRLVRERVHIKPGKPVFGTVVIDSDYIVYLKASDELLRERSKKRRKDYTDSKNMQAQLEKEIKSSKIPYAEIYINE
jgi:bifunctional DNA-binding transcriptional regulator/antitoxin component of YhaV-PrlF toxin-antitoxin module